MNMDYIVAELVAERDRLNAAIGALGGPTGASPQRPTLTFDQGIVQTAGYRINGARKERVFTAAYRRRQSERMKAFWAARRKGVKKSR